MQPCSRANGRASTTASTTHLRERFPELVAARPEMAAYHAENAGRREAAIPLLRDAGVRALGRAAVAEAVKHLAHGIELVEVLEEPFRTTMEIELQGAIGPAYMATMGWAAPEVEHASSRLRDLPSPTGMARGRCKRCGASGRSIFYGDAWGLRWRSPPGSVHGQSGRDPLFETVGHQAVGYTHFYRGEYEDALRHAKAGLALFDLEREKRNRRALPVLVELRDVVVSRRVRADAGVRRRSRRQSAERPEAERRPGPSADACLSPVPAGCYSLPSPRRCRSSRGAGSGAARAVDRGGLRPLGCPWPTSSMPGRSRAREATPSRRPGRSTRLSTLVHDSRTYLNEPDLASMYAETLAPGR